MLLVGIPHRAGDLRRSARAMKLVLALMAALLMGCASVRFDVPRHVEHAIDDPQDTVLARNFAAQLTATPGQSGVRLMPSGEEAFLARAALAHAAQRTLDLQYYIVAPDTTGTLLIYQVLRAAERGVRVRILIDDVAVGGRDADLAALAAHPNVEVRVFNPFARRQWAGLGRVLDYLGDGERLNRRMHNKLWIADNAAALIGGRNLGDAYFNADSQSNFADLDVLAVGPVVAEASRSFDQYWNSEWAVPIQAFTGLHADAGEVQRLRSAMEARVGTFRNSNYARALRATDLAQLVRNGRLAVTPAYARVLYDPPAKVGRNGAEPAVHVMSNLREAIEAARNEVTLVSPYFVPNEQGISLLCELQRRGVRVRVLTNSLASTDVPVVHGAYVRYRRRLLACGAQLYEMRPGAVESSKSRSALSSGVSLHAKAIGVDHRLVLVGSMNLDPRSRLSNTEIGVLIDSEAVAHDLDAWFDAATSLDHSFKPELDVPGDPSSSLSWVGRSDDGLVRYRNEPLASRWQRAVSGALGAVLPEDWL